MQRLTFNSASRSTFLRLNAASISSGIRFAGQCATHRPQRIQAVGSGRIASFFVSARMAFVFFRIGCSRSGTAMPIIVPP